MSINAERINFLVREEIFYTGRKCFLPLCEKTFAKRLQFTTVTIDV